MAGIAIVITFFAVAAYALPAPTTKKPEYLAGIALIIVGAGLVILGIVNWRRSAGKPIGTGPKWLQAVGRLGPWSSLALALGLNLRPKSILLGAAGGIFLANPSLSRASSVAVLVIYSVVAASTVGAPIIATLIAPNEMEKKLLAVRNWMEKNNKVISLLIAIMIGIFIIGYGMTRL
ncbi:uncharacterized protein YneF (UPF0154 family) [Paeniglutamicibacter cryotolerans]|uniref:Uncharacterized protein YneF (UPF0154 family) n=1 Tax=Paeniglutamicibacter cryotolerans TaxID=670079 RepID=A0A839QN15_9MICC|nr:uncharacterized protein YneF (UPF0154 family) [Paeniglutamicibacter cryotolerans]